MKKKLRLEVGKFYRNRRGEKVRIVADDLSKPYSILGVVYQANHNTDDTWTAQGRSYIHEEVCRDLVEEWVERPEVDWSLMPSWATHVARDYDGTWYFYTCEPRIQPRALYWNTSFYGVSDLPGIIPAASAPKFDGPWDKSMVARKQ